jgi:transcriptional regulator with XRE-family HTH domain
MHLSADRRQRNLNQRQVETVEEYDADDDSEQELLRARPRLAVYGVMCGALHDVTHGAADWTDALEKAFPGNINPRNDPSLPRATTDRRTSHDAMSTEGVNQYELGVFLRARRAELSPSDVDLPEGGRQRRVAGLRREEVAQLAAISIDYYTRLEQGRIQPSAPVLASLARVLRLTDDQRAYMSELVGAPTRSRRRTKQKVKPYLKRILSHIDAPAIVMTPIHDVLAWNPLAAALMVDFGEVPERERNFVYLLFTDPRLRSLYPEWEELARAVVSYLRMDAARKPDDPRLAELVGDLSVRDAQFRQWWAGTTVATKRRGSRRYTHPIVGEIVLEWDALTSDAEPDQQIVVYVPETGSRSEAAVRELAVWASKHISQAE